MKYRIAQLTDGTYQAQWRFLFVFWTDSAYGPSKDIKDVQGFVDHTRRAKPRVARVVAT